MIERAGEHSFDYTLHDGHGANTGPDTLRLLVIWGAAPTTDWSSFGAAQAGRRAR